MRKIYLYFLFSFLILTNCSVQKLAVRSMSGILDNSMAALYEENDLILAERAIASDLKLLEGLIKTDPQNDKLLLLACQGFGAYTLGFVEDDDPERAENLYLRGKEYGMRILNENSAFRQSQKKSFDEMKKALQSFKKEDIPALFWTANNWASWINLNFGNTDALADLPKVQLIMERVIQLDEGYFYGGAHLFFATIYAVRPPILGGDMKKAKQHFDRCFEFSQDKFLLPYVYYGKYYVTRLLDEDLFKETMTNVIETPDDILPEQTLPNTIAKQKAKKLLAQMEDIF